MPILNENKRNELLTELQSIDGSTRAGNKKRTEILIKLVELK